MSDDELIRKAKNEYMRNYYKKNKKRIAEINRKCWLKKIANATK